MGKQDKRGRSTRGPAFISLPRHVKRSAAYHGLSHKARCALIEIIDRHDGINNGFIGLGVRELADELVCSTSTANRALAELDDAGLIRPVKLGSYKHKTKWATEWRLMFKRCDVTGDAPVKNWKPKPQSQNRGNTVSPVGTATRHSPTSETQTRKNPMNGKTHSPTSDTHIDIHHRAEPDSRDWLVVGGV